MDQEEREFLAEAWVDDTEASGVGRSELPWSISILMDLELDDAEELWQIILLILPRTHFGDLAYASLAAGPLEDLLVRYGDAFIDRVEEQARADPEFGRLLGGVWRNAMTDEVWTRVQAASEGSVW